MWRWLRGIGNFFRVMSLPCESMTGLISHDLDAPLPASARFAYKFHLLYCTACRRYRTQLTRLRAALRVAAGLSGFAAGSLTPAARQRILADLRRRD